MNVIIKWLDKFWIVNLSLGEGLLSLSKDSFYLTEINWMVRVEITEKNKGVVLRYFKEACSFALRKYRKGFYFQKKRK